MTKLNDLMNIMRWHRFKSDGLEPRSAALRFLSSSSWVALLAAGMLLHSASPVAAQGDQTQADPAAKEITQPEDDVFVPDFEDNDLEGSQERAWEYRPYNVAVWFCLDGSPALNAVYSTLSADVTRRSELLDASGWDLTTGKAPSKWRNRFLKHIDTPEKCEGFAELESLQKYDKLMIVCLEAIYGKTQVRVREFDIKTQQWGPMLVRNVAQKHRLGVNVMDAISIAFMPLARIERVQEVKYTDDKGKNRIRDEVVMQVRAIQSCTQTRLNERLQLEVRPIKGSPVFISQEDRFLPVIRRTDRQGKLVGLEPLEFTFLTVNPPEAEEDSPEDGDSETQSNEETVEDTSIADQDGESAADESELVVVQKDMDLLNPILTSSIQSYHRAPLAQRKSKRAQKFALVIRPPERSTKLFLHSADKLKTPMEGFEIWSRKPGSSRDEKSEFLGKTDWRGSLEIPPSPEGLRLIYVKRGSRALKKLPIMPGLYDSVSTTLPNDETRLYAEGVIQGFQNEILSLVIRRDVLEGDIEKAIKDKDFDLARTTLNELQDLETPKEFKDRMSIDEGQLKTLTSDNRELGYINRSFETLKKILDEQGKKSRELEFLDSIQKEKDKSASSPE